MRTRLLTEYQTLRELARLRGVDYADWFRRKHRLGESILVDIGAGVKGTVTADGVTRDNLLLANFGALLFGTLMDANAGPVLTTGNYSTNLRTSGDVSNDAFYIAIGTGTTPPAMTDYTLTSSASLSTSRALSYFDTETQVIGTATADRSFNEVGIAQSLFDSGNAIYTFLLARSLMSGGSGTPIVYRIRFQSPWLQNFAQIMYGIMTNSNQLATDISGVTFTSRSSGDVGAGASYLVGSPNSIDWSPALTSVPNAYSLSTDRLFSNPRVLVMLVLVGYIVPSSTTTLATLGLYQDIYDTSGASRATALGVIPLPQPVDMPANRVTVVFIRFVLM